MVVEDAKGDKLCIDYALLETMTQTRVEENQISLGVGAKRQRVWKFRNIERNEDVGGASVLKYGRTTATTGIVNGVASDIRGLARFLGITFKFHAVAGKLGTAFIRPGDSGCLVVTEDGAILGLGCATGSSDELRKVDLGLYVPIGMILDRIESRYGLQLSLA